MKPFLTLLVVVLLVLGVLGVLAGCASGPNPSKGTAREHGGVAGFWLGLWQGFIAGADAVGTADQVAATLRQQTDAYRELSSSLAYDDAA